MEILGLRALLSLQAPAQRSLQCEAPLQGLLLVMGLLLTAPAASSAGVHAGLPATPRMAYAFTVTIVGGCAIAALLVVVDEAGRAQRTYLRVRRAWGCGMRRQFPSSS